MKTMHQLPKLKKKQDKHRAKELRRSMNIAGYIGCPNVKASLARELAGLLGQKERC